MYRSLILAFALVAACNGGRGKGDGGLQTQDDFGTGGDGGIGPQMGCEGQPQGCYTVFAHADHVLYTIDLMQKQLVTVGPFNAPQVTNNGKTAEDVITDLAVSPDDVIWAVSNTNLYTADRYDGHVTKVASLQNCGMVTVALTFTPDAKMYAADFLGAFCEIDYTANPPTVRKVADLGSGMAVSGDLVAVADGTMYATAYRLSDASGTGTQVNNLLVKVNPATGSVTTVGSTGYPKLFGVAFALGQVFGFTHDQTGHVVTINPTTGKGTLFGTFNDPMTNMPISFAGAAVNSLVAPIQ